MPDLSRPHVIDGAMATELERRGASLNDALWSARILLENPELIEAVHYDYYCAGADIAITASYQATLPGLAARGLRHDESCQLIQRSVALACAARHRHLDTNEADPCRPAALVAASIGPFGAHRHDGSEYHGNYGVSSRVITEFHRQQVDVLAAAGADLLAFETIPSLAEGEAVVRLLEEYPGVPVWLSFSCRDGQRVCHGEDFARCTALAEENSEIAAIGLNCTAPQYVSNLLMLAAGSTSKPLLAYPNSGETWRAGDNRWLAANCEHVDLSSRVAEWLDSGARLIGGCCRTTPDDIRGIAGVVHAAHGSGD